MKQARYDSQHLRLDAGHVGVQARNISAGARSAGADDRRRADAAGQHCSRGHCGTPIHDEYRLPRAGPSHRASRQCRGLG